MDESDAGTAGGSNGKLSSRVLVLNRNYVAVRVTTARRAFGLLFKECAEVLDFEDDRYLNFGFAEWIARSDDGYARNGGNGEYVRTPRHAILLPRVIRLMRYDRVPRNEVKFSRRNILARDEHRCQYCGARPPAGRLSLDHVVPKSRGGATSWTNVVAACGPCNGRKGGRLPAEAGMRLLRRPGAPRRSPFVTESMRGGRYEIWGRFVRERDGRLA
ncbi:MAG: HNH endonuclease [Planctomycetota bacterium]|jgi:5-methylcytosine-specific restriction endonuclease McrA